MWHIDSKKTEAFLKKALKGQEYSQIPLVEEGSERRYTRILLKTSCPNPVHQAKQRQDKSWILAISPLKQKKYFLWRQADFLKAGLNVPHLHPSHTYANTQSGFLLLEDLGTQSLEKEVQESKNFPWAYYHKALKALIKLQKKESRFFQAGPTPSAWTKDDLLQEMLYTEKYLIQKFLKYKLEGLEKAEMLKEWQTICDKIAHYPFLPGHRDFHSRNLFIKNNHIYMIDFQDAGFFPRFYDAVSLIYDVYIDSYIDPTIREQLLTYFVSESQLQENPARREEIALTALQRLFQAVGRFAGFYCLKKQKTHLKHIYPGLKMQIRLLQTELLTPSLVALGPGQNQRPAYPAFLKLAQRLRHQASLLHRDF